MSRHTESKSYPLHYDCVKKFFPFALFRLQHLENLLTQMYNHGWAIVDIKLGCILVFRAVSPVVGIQYVVLTKLFHQRWAKEWDVSYLKQILPTFQEGNGKQFCLSWMAEFEYHIYRINNIGQAELNNLRQYRKKRILRINLLKIFIFLFITMVTLKLLFFLFIYILS